VAEAVRNAALVVAKPRPGISGIVWAVLAIAALSAGWLLRGRAEGGAPPAQRVGTLLHLEPFVINLADPEQRSYLRVGLDLEIGNVSFNGSFKEEARAAIMARVRDTILEVLTQRGPDELLTAEGKTRLKHELAHALQQRDPELQVEEVYFTEFLVQR
jgi:flagellar protein FliL